MIMDESEAGAMCSNFNTNFYLREHLSDSQRARATLHANVISVILFVCPLDASLRSQWGPGRPGASVPDVRPKLHPAEEAQDFP